MPGWGEMNEPDHGCRRFLVEIDTTDPRAGMITPGQIGDVIKEDLELHNISFGAIRVERDLNRGS